MKIYIGSDHGGFGLKERLKSYIEKKGLEVMDLGCKTADACDYPEFAHLVAEKVAALGERGILICGTGQGMAITANRHQGIRAAVCWTHEIARLARAHNDANILCLGEKFIPEDLAKEIVEVFLETKFDGGRHARRTGKIESC